MKTTLVLLAVLALLPLAAARPDLPELDADGVRFGSCEVRWSWYWPGETVGVTCTEGGRTLVAFSHGTCALGHYTYVQVGNAYAHVPCDPWMAPALA